MKKTLLALSVLLTVLSSSAYAEQKIERSRSGDKGKYFLVEKKNVGDKQYKVITKRIGVDSVGYTLMIINCKNKMIKELGYSEESSKNIKEDNEAKWCDVVNGSSKYDTVNFVCK